MNPKAFFRLLTVYVCLSSIHSVFAETGTHQAPEVAPVPRRVLETAPMPRLVMKALPPLERLREALKRTAIKTVPDIDKYSCGDFFHDYEQFFTLKETHPTYLADHIDPKLAKTPLERRVFDYMEQRTKFTRELRSLIGTAIALEDLEKPFNAMSHASARKSFEQIYECGEHGVPPLFCGSHAYNAFCYNFEDRMTPRQKMAMLDITSCLYDGRPLEETGQKSPCRVLSESPMIRETLQGDLLKAVNQYWEAENVVYGMLGSPELKSYCLNEMLPGYSEFAKTCPKESDALTQVLTPQIEKRKGEFRAEAFKVANAADCDGRLKTLYGRSFPEGKPREQALQIFDKFHLYLAPAAGFHAKPWTAESINELSECLANFPEPYAKGLPLTAARHYNIGKGNTSGWYWGQIESLVLNGDPLNCGTALHELTHGWDRANKVGGKDQKLHNEWLRIGEFKKYKVAGVPDSSIQLSCTNKFASGYARCNPSEDFAVTVSEMLLDPFKTKRKLPEKFAFLEKEVFKTPFDLQGRVNGWIEEYPKVNDEAVRQKLFKKIADAGELAVDFLDKEAEHPDRWRKREALSALAEAGDTGADRFLLHLTSNDENMRQMAAESMKSMMSYLGSQEKVPSVSRSFVRNFAGLSGQRKDRLAALLRGPFLDEVVETLGDKELRKPAEDLLRFLLSKPGSHYSLLVKLSKANQNPSAAILLAEIEKKAGKELKEILNDRRAQAVAEARDTLKKVDSVFQISESNQALEPILAMGEKGYEELRKFALDGELSEFSRKESLTKLIKDTGPDGAAFAEKMLADPKTAKIAASSLWAGGAAVLPLVSRELTATKDAAVARELARQLYLIGYKEGRMAARQLIDKVEREKVAAILEEVFKYSEDTVIPLMAHKRTEVREEAVKMLAGRNSKDTFEAVAKHLDDKDDLISHGSAAVFATHSGRLYLAEHFDPKPGTKAYELMKKAASTDKDVLAKLAATAKGRKGAEALLKELTGN